MFRKLQETFTATHLTIMFGIAVAAPTALYGAVTYQPVSIVDPNVGNKALVDAGRRLYVYDPTAGLAANPLNYVRLSGACTNAGGSSLNYAPPSGKALIVKAVDFTYYGGTSGGDNYGYLLAGSNMVAGVESSDPAGGKNSELGTGYYIQNGETLTLSCANAPNGSTYNATVTGYLVGAATVPPVGTPAAAGQSVAGPMTKGGKRL